MSRPDASMSLLTDLQAEALEPEYRTTTARGAGGGRRLLVVGLLALLITVAVLQTTQGAGAAADARGELLLRVTAAQARQDELTSRVTALEDEIGRLGLETVGDPAQRRRLAELEALTGATSVTGPGIVVVVDDAQGATNAQGLVLDTDLSRLINGLWEAGAEAVAVNGRRVTTLTPIRSAGAAITVDFVSLSPPYRVEAIGDPDTMPARFNRTSAATWWHFLTQNYGITMDVDQAMGDLELPGDPGQALRHTRKK